jgi:hypothetical protein
MAEALGFEVPAGLAGGPSQPQLDLDGGIPPEEELMTSDVPPGEKIH